MNGPCLGGSHDIMCISTFGITFLTGGHVKAIRANTALAVC